MAELLTGVESQGDPAVLRRRFVRVRLAVDGSVSRVEPPRGYRTDGDIVARLRGQLEISPGWLLGLGARGLARGRGLVVRMGLCVVGGSVSSKDEGQDLPEAGEGDVDAEPDMGLDADDNGQDPVFDDDRDINILVGVDPVGQ